jgi:hypothetical protein
MSQTIISRLGLAGVIAVAGCQSLPDVGSGICGNLVLETGEDCDGFGDGEGTSCGNPGTVNGCFFVCDRNDPESQPCPAGYGCGADGRCRRPSTQFVESFQETFPVAEFKVADIDGDATPDLVGTSQNAFHIAFGEGDGGLNHQVVPNVAFGGAFSLGDLDGDGRTDIVTTDSNGVTAFLGRPGKTVEPVPFATFQVSDSVAIKVVSLRGVYGLLPTDDERLIVFFDDPGSGKFIDDDGEALGEITTVFNDPGFRVDLIETPLDVADIDSDQNQELAITYQLADRVWVLGFDETISNRGLGVLAELPLPDGYRANGRAHFADLDGNGTLDVAIGMVKGNLVALGQAFGNGAGGFSAVSKATIFGESDFESPGLKLLDVGQLDGDGRADYVFSSGIVLADASGVPGLLGVLATGTFTNAAVVDLNRDGRNDVVAVPNAVPGVEVYLQADETPTRLNRFAFGTSSHFAGTREVVVGDFDGDLIDDIGLTSRSQATGDSLEVVFGSLSADFIGPVKMGRFDEIVQIQPGRVLSPINLTDAIDDMVVVARQTGGSASSKILSLFRGDPSRAMSVPLLLFSEDPDDPTGEILFLPIQTAVGQIDGGTGILVASISANASLPDAERECSTATLSAGCGFAWSLPVVDGLVTAPAAPSVALEINDQDLLCYEWDAVDLFNTDSDELLGVFSSERCPGNSAATPVVYYDLADGIRQPISVGDESAATLAEFVSGDLDNDGLTDVVSVLERRSSDDDDGGVVVLWNESPTFRPEVVAAEGIEVLAVAKGRLDADPFDDLVLLGKPTDGNEQPQVYAAFYDSDGGAYTVPELQGEFGFGTSIGIADLDRDGLGDIVIGDGTLARVFLAQPAPPRGDEQAESGEGEAE